VPIFQSSANVNIDTAAETMSATTTVRLAGLKVVDILYLCFQSPARDLNTILESPIRFTDSPTSVSRLEFGMG
jgi:hypothetical protein